MGDLRRREVRWLWLDQIPPLCKKWRVSAEGGDDVRHCHDASATVPPGRNYWRVSRTLEINPLDPVISQIFSRITSP